MNALNGPTQGQLPDFFAFIKQTKWIVLTILSVGTSSALVAYFSGIAPPWPDAIIAITCIVELFALMIVYLQHNVSSKKTVLKYIKFYFFVFICAMFVYSMLISQFIYTAPTTGERYVIGFVCKSDILLIKEDSCPFLSEADFADANYEPGVLWTTPSITLMRTAILMVWLAIFWSIIYSSAAFVMYSRKTGRKSILSVSEES